MIKILITGSNGQLGSEIRLLAGEYPAMDLFFTDVDELDITDEDQLSAFFSVNRFDAVINCAAYTAVDKAEEEPEKAMNLNADAVRKLVKVASAHGCYPVQISTDYVFEGKNYRPYKEDDKPGPVSVYGRSKFQGEVEFLKGTDKGMILRTSWLYSSFGNNFIKTIIRKAKDEGKLRIVSDQVGSPTYAHDLARCILEILPIAIAGKIKGVYHFANEGACSWYDLALEAVKSAGIECEVEAVGSEEFRTTAKRPFYSVMDTRRIKKEFAIQIPHWRESLEKCVKLLQAKS